MADLNHVPTIGGSAYAGCTPMYTIAEMKGDGVVRSRGFIVVSDHSDTLKLNSLGWSFPRHLARVTPEGGIEEIKPEGGDSRAIGHAVTL